MNELELKLSSEYAPILSKIDSILPRAIADTENFNKASSQFKTTTLDITDLTPINSAKHLLASIQRTRHALEEATITIKRKRLKLKRKENEYDIATAEKKESLEIDIEELKNQIEQIEASGRGAVRRLSFLLDQYQGILDLLGKDFLSESDYEKDQVRYHIMTAFNQALIAARSRGGLIDEGNHIYLFQLGINGAVAQQEITAFLEAEQNALMSGKTPLHSNILQWLNLIAEKFEKSPELYVTEKMMKLVNPDLVLEGKK